MEPHATPPEPAPTPWDAEASIRHAYRTVRVHAGSTEALTVLHIGAEHTVVATGEGAEAAATLVLPIGALKTAQTFFRRSPPTPLEMENAIATVEDEVMRLAALLPPRARRDALSRSAEGRPAVLEGLPDSTAFAAVLLILREFMHHLAFSAIRVSA